MPRKLSPIMNKKARISILEVNVSNNYYMIKNLEAKIRSIENTECDEK